MPSLIQYQRPARGKKKTNQLDFTRRISVSQRTTWVVSRFLPVRACDRAILSCRPQSIMDDSVPVAVDSLAPARSALAGLHLRSNSFRTFPSCSSVHLHHFAGPAMRDGAAVGPAFAQKLRPGRQEIRRVGKDGVEPAVGIFGGDGVEQFEAVAVVEPDFFGRKNQAWGWGPVFATLRRGKLASGVWDWSAGSCRAEASERRQVTLKCS